MTRNNLEKLRMINARLNQSRVLGIAPSYHKAVKDKLNTFLSSNDVPVIDEDGDVTLVEPVPREIPFSIINVCGYIVKAGGLDQETCDDWGICDLDNVREQLKAARDNDNVILVALNFDTPGGEVIGVPELFDLIDEVSQKKLVIGYCAGLCCSAGYWLASACPSLYGTESSLIGNVGCYTERDDYTEMYNKEGIKIDVIKDGEYKAFGHPATVMSDEEKKYLQEQVTEIGTDFRKDILSKRQIDTTNLQGQTFLGRKAADPSINLLDANIPDLEDLLTVFAHTLYLSL